MVILDGELPVVFWITAFHFLADFFPGALPEAFKVVGNLQGTVGRGEQAEEYFCAHDLWSFYTAKKSLNYDFDYGADYKLSFILWRGKQFIFYLAFFPVGQAD